MMRADSHLVALEPAGVIEGLRLSENGAHRVHSNDDAVRALLFDLAASASHCASSASPHDEHVYLAIALSKQLLCCAVIVRQRVAGVLNSAERKRDMQKR